MPSRARVATGLTLGTLAGAAFLSGLPARRLVRNEVQAQERSEDISVEGSAVTFLGAVASLGSLSLADRVLPPPGKVEVEVVSGGVTRRYQEDGLLVASVWDRTKKYVFLSYDLSGNLLEVEAKVEDVRRIWRRRRGGTSSR